MIKMNKLRGGTIYQNGGPKKGTISLRKRTGFRFVPQTFILGGLFGVLIVFSPLLAKEAEYRISSLKQEKFVVADKEVQKGELSPLLKKEGVKILHAVDPQFSILIPKIGVNSKVLANISATDDSQYDQALRAGVAHAAGTYLPGENGTVYLFGHSTDYIWNVPRFNAVFYLLKELKKEDEIDLIYQGKRHIYRVSDRKIVDAGEVYYLKPKWGKEQVILQTCWPPGTTWKRLLIFAQPKTETLAQKE